MYFTLFVGVLCLSLFCYALLCVQSSFAIILKRKRKLVTLLLLSHICIVTINVLWLFLAAPWVSMQCVIVVFPDHSHFMVHKNLHTPENINFPENRKNYRNSKFRHPLPTNKYKSEHFTPNPANISRCRGSK